MFSAVKLAALATTTAWRTRSGYCMAQLVACIPPKLPPITAANCAMPKASSNAACALTQSSTVTTGKSAPHIRPVSGLSVVGPLEPKQEPMLLTPITKNRSVSTGLPGPTMLSHHPSLLARTVPSSSTYTPATWCEAFRAWQMSTALLLSAHNSPYVS